jgi:hypothetical protein
MGKWEQAKGFEKGVGTLVQGERLVEIEELKMDHGVVNSVGGLSERKVQQDYSE